LHKKNIDEHIQSESNAESDGPGNEEEHECEGHLHEQCQQEENITMHDKCVELWLLRSCDKGASGCGTTQHLVKHHP
jgi:hypothetical protein